MSDHPMTDAEAAQAFAAHVDELSERYEGPLPGARERLEKILAEHEAECVRLEREEAERGRLTQTA